MNSEMLTKGKVEFFFNKYKYNLDLIYRIERRILKESWEFQKWERLLNDNSNLTRKLFVDNEAIIEAYFKPALTHPENLLADTLHTFLLHITFFLFENNIDMHITEDLLRTFLDHPEILNTNTKFHALMCLGIARTLSIKGTFEETFKIFENACSIFPDFSSIEKDYDTCIHIVFARTFELLSFDLYETTDYSSFLETYNNLYKLLKSGNDKLYSKMWENSLDFEFHINYLMRFMRIYGIFMANKNEFKLGNNNSQKNIEALKTINSWIEQEYFEEEKEGEINFLIFTAFNRLKLEKKEISQEYYTQILKEKFWNFKQTSDKTKEFIFPELSFPDDNDPICKQFSKQLDKMKLFNWSFSYVFVFLKDLICFSKEEETRLAAIKDAIHYFESSKYADKGFCTDKFLCNLLKIIAKTFNNVSDFINLTQTIFIRRQISTSMHIGMISSIAEICFYYLVDKKPKLFKIPEKFESTESILKNKAELLKFLKNGAILHDLGKLNLTHLVNLHCRKITNREYSSITSHTTYGIELIKDIPYLADYKDFIWGHHKYWNDEKGYPENFKIQKSPIKYYVALIAIADTIDTATDSKGRNYTEGKNFDEVFKEIKENSGTQYCPEIVKLIDENEDLKDELRKLTSIGRNYNSYQTYTKYIRPNTNFSEEDERSVSLLNDLQKENLHKFFKDCYPKATDENIKNRIAEISEGNSSRVFVLHDKNENVFGILSGNIETVLSENKTCFLTKNIIVHPSLRRKGFGMELIAAAARFLRMEDVHRINVIVKQDLSSETFFWISGFSKTNEYLMEKLI